MCQRYLFKKISKVSNVTVNVNNIETEDIGITTFGTSSIKKYLHIVGMIEFFSMKINVTVNSGKKISYK